MFSSSNNMLNLTVRTTSNNMDASNSNVHTSSMASALLNKEEDITKVPHDINVEYYDYVNYLDDVSAVLVPWSEDRAYLPTTLTYGLTFVCGMTGNILMIARLLATMRRQQRGVHGGRRSVTSLFLLSLALSDLVFILFCVPYDVSVKMFSQWSAGVVMCKMSTYVHMLCAEASVLCLTAVSIERHIVIVFPMRAREWCDASNYRRAVALVWLSACLLSSPALLLVETKHSVFYNNVTRVTMVTCSEVGSSIRLVIAWYQVIVMFVIPTIIIGCCSVSVVRVLWRSTRTFQQLTSQSSSVDNRLCKAGKARTLGMRVGEKFSNSSSKTTSVIGLRRGGKGVSVSSWSLQQESKAPLAPPGVRQTCSARSLKSLQGGTGTATGSPSTPFEPSAGIIAARKQIIKLLLAIAVAFLLCWAPKCVLDMMRRYSGGIGIFHSDGAFYVMLVANLLPFVHGCLNPILYGLMVKDTSRMWRALSRCCCSLLFVLVSCRRRRPRPTWQLGGDDGVNYEKTTCLSAASTTVPRTAPIVYQNNHTTARPIIVQKPKITRSCTATTCSSFV